MITFPEGYSVKSQLTRTAAKVLDDPNQKGWIHTVTWDTPHGEKYTHTRNPDIKHFQTDLFWGEALNCVVNFVKQGMH